VYLAVPLNVKLTPLPGEVVRPKLEAWQLVSSVVPPESVPGRICFVQALNDKALATKPHRPH